jgi:hypothetical protein
MPTPLLNPLFTETGSLEVKITFGQFQTASQAYIGYVDQFPDSEFIVPLSLEKELRARSDFNQLSNEDKAKWLLFKMLRLAEKSL